MVPGQPPWCGSLLTSLPIHTGETGACGTGLLIPASCVTGSGPTLAAPKRHPESSFSCHPRGHCFQQRQVRSALCPALKVEDAGVCPTTPKLSRTWLFLRPGAPGTRDRVPACISFTPTGHTGGLVGGRCKQGPGSWARTPRAAVGLSVPSMESCSRRQSPRPGPPTNSILDTGQADPLSFPRTPAHALGGSFRLPWPAGHPMSPPPYTKGRRLA